ncbi:thiopeptide-type bacteriocin biosynthesis protein [Streptomyces sp. NPDC052496]|uniref:thiopeptide-type bacteriocin biosynthesis protein n=1 Tax=Streptomyces sp. NPDC052496 TaxID=3154951 RepID=UPI0034433EFF
MLPVAELLADCLRDVRDARGVRDARDGALGMVPVVREDPAYPEARRAFLAAGLAALRDEGPGADWVQVNLETGAGVRRGLYGRLAETVRELQDAGAVREFFFMHKPPGLRLRFQAPSRDGRDALRDALLKRFAGADGLGAELTGPPVGGVYEPETYLFGGPRAMPYVHRIFTADSLAWLDHHARPAAAGAIAPAAPPVADWRVSLTLLRDLLDGLGIVGWEHRGVWESVRDDTGRRLADGHGPGAEDARRAADGIRAFWRRDREELTAGLPAPERAALDAHRDAVGAAARQWRTGYFESGEARGTGPRRAAAYCVIFHWNRGRLSVARQALLTAALAAPEMSRAPAAAPRPVRAPGTETDRPVIKAAAVADTAETAEMAETVETAEVAETAETAEVTGAVGAAEAAGAAEASGSSRAAEAGVTGGG